MAGRPNCPPKSPGGAFTSQRLLAYDARRTHQGTLVPFGGNPMRQSVRTSLTAAAIFAAAMVPAMHSQPAAAQPAGLYVNAVDLDIVPAEMDKYMAAIKENGAAAVKEPGCREFNITVQANNPNHVFLFEVYDNEAALQAHRATEHFKKYQATTANMVAKREVRAFTSVAMNAKSH
jgi:quinol monooxygenase YgiN